ncbi:MAG: rubrerythrin family protein [Chitinivibrionales bacterium]|nr:rubrerythrin family protein [Chitinivibrionales bacterium]
MNLKGSQTEKNLLTSFAGESQARNRYTYAASAATKEGFIQIANVFAETAENEKEHAKRMFKFLEGGPVEIVATYPAGKTGSTKENLAAAAEGENEEQTVIYPGFARTARAEGFDKIAEMYEAIAVAERQHEKRYRGLLANINNGSVFKKDKIVRWRCSNCGFIHEGPEAPKTCPACVHPQAYFEVLAENW